MTENGSENTPAPEFNEVATTAPDTTPEKSFPYPAELEQEGIKTESVFNHRMTQTPEPPGPMPTPDDPAGYETALRKARADHQAEVARQREEFRENFGQVRRDFNDRSREK